MKKLYYVLKINDKGKGDSPIGTIQRVIWHDSSWITMDGQVLDQSDPAYENFILWVKEHCPHWITHDKIIVPKLNP